MSHDSQLRFFEVWVEHFASHFASRVIDFGSWDVNGGPHELIEPLEYVGVDLAEGPNVTLACPGELLDLPTGYFDVAMSSECFEHAPSWAQILGNTCRLVRPGGLVLFSCAGRGRPEHGTIETTPGDAQAANAKITIAT